MSFIRKSILLFLLAALFLLSACSLSVEKKIPGAWRVEDVNFVAEDPAFLDSASIARTIKDQKAILYELNADHSMKIRTGSSTIDGSWMYNKEDKGVYVIFSGTLDNLLLGKYEKGKLINEEKDEGFTITTIFSKERKLN